MKFAVWFPLLLLLVAYPFVSHIGFANGWSARWLFYAPPILIYAGLLITFALTLRAGQEPLIARFARMEQGSLTVELARYTRNLTWLWCAFFALTASLSLALAVWASLVLWSLFTHLVSYILLGVLLVGEYGYRRWRFPHYHHASLWQMFKNIRANGLR